jgi:hypothetical protein
MHSILVTFSSSIKEYFPSRIGYSPSMRKMHPLELFAHNLRAAIERHYDGVVNQSALSRDSTVSQKAISFYLSALKPENRPHLDDLPSPSLENIFKLAATLNVEPWELLHPDPEKAKREREFYERIEKDFMRLPALESQQEVAADEDRRETTRRKSDQVAALNRAKRRGSSLIVELDKKKKGLE